MEDTMKNIKRTITSIFMVPTLKIPKDELLKNGFINAFNSDSMRDIQYENCIYLLFKPSQIDQFREFLQNEYDRTKDIIDDYDYPNGFVVVVYKLNEKYENDFGLVRLGKYSKTSKEFQSEFPKVVKITVNGLHRDEISLQYRVFKRTEDLIKFWEDKFDMAFDDEQEIWNGYIEDEETLTEEKLKSYE